MYTVLASKRVGLVSNWSTTLCSSRFVSVAFLGAGSFLIPALKKLIKEANNRDDLEIKYFITTEARNRKSRSKKAKANSVEALASLSLSFPFFCFFVLWLYSFITV